MGARVLLIDPDGTSAAAIAAPLQAGAEPFEVSVADGLAAALVAQAATPHVCALVAAPPAAQADLIAGLRAAHPALPLIALVDDPAGESVAIARGAAAALVRAGEWRFSLAGAVRDVLGRGALEEANARMARGLLVGRDAEMHVLRDAIAAVGGGHGRLILIGGDAGIGKTALAVAVSQHAAQRGCRVVWARCDASGGAPPYWPWSQVLRALVWPGDLDPLLDKLGAGAAELAELVPAIAARLPDDAGRLPPDSDEARFRLFDGVALCLKAVALRQPLLLCIDDLHGADLSSLRLLRHVAQEIVGARIGIVATHRPPEGEHGRPLLGALGELRCAPTHLGLPLHGLSGSGVRELLSAIAGQDVPADFAEAFHLRTEGNPLFVHEIARHLVEEGVLFFDGQQWTSRFTPEELPIPPGVADVIRRRLSHLSPACRDALARAAVIGREFAAALLVQLIETPAADDGAALDEALRARVIAATAPEGAFRFAHPLIRETLYADLPVARRVHLHRLVARALEAGDDAARETRLAELAYHFCEAAPDGDLDRAIDYARRAGARATHAMAHEEAARCYERALRALRLSGIADEAARGDLLVRLGGALWRTGAFEPARQMARQAVEIARRIDAAEILAHAALALAGDLQGFGLVVCDDEVVALLEEALERLGDADSALRARLMARLAEELSIAPDSQRRLQLASGAVEMARRLDDPAVLGGVLRTAHWALWTPEGRADRLAQADEILRLARRTGDAALRLDGQLFRVWALLERGDAVETRQALDRAGHWARGLRQGYYHWLLATTRACWAFAEGRLDLVEPLVADALAHGGQPDAANTTLFAGVQLAHLRWMTGQFDELRGTLTGFGERYPLLDGIVHCSLAITASERGDRGETRRLFEQLAARDFADLPRNVLWPTCIACLAEACAMLGDERRAPLLYELLLPFADQSIARPPVIVWGAGAYYLGLLAATMRRWDDAEDHFQAAIAFDSGMGRRHWVARARVAYAAALLASGRSAAPAIAALLADAEEAAVELGMPALLARIAGLRQPGDADQAAAAPPLNGRRAAAPIRAVLRRDGELWTATFGGRTCHLKDRKGLHRLREILRHPDVEIDARWLMRITERNGDAPSPAAVRFEQRGCGPSLDPRARRDGQARVRALREQLDEADADGDRGRQEALRAELEQLLDWVESGLDINHLDREERDDLERARSAVVHSTGDALKELAQHLPALADHLHARLRCGVFSVYAPDPQHPVVWEL